VGHGDAHRYGVADKKDLGRNAKNLAYFDAIVFASTTGELVGKHIARAQTEFRHAKNRTCRSHGRVKPNGLPGRSKGGMRQAQTDGLCDYL
jgi:hypothetical protein